MQCVITGITHRGEGVTRIEGKVVFIPFALPGEVVDVEISQEKRKYSRGVIKELLESSVDRVAPRCPDFYACGACAYQHVDYLRELDLKRQVVISNMKRIGGLDVPVHPVIGMKDPWHYRNKVTWHIGMASGAQKLMGYYEAGSKRVSPIKECQLIPEKIKSISSLLADNVSSISGGEGASLVIRQSSYDKKTMVLFLDCQPDKSLVKRLNGMVDSLFIYRGSQLKHIFGPPRLLEKAGDNIFKLSPGSFFQVNPYQTEILLSKVKEYLNLQGYERVLDAYCGAGSIALNIADQALKVTGIESFPAAVEDARDNAVLNNISNCEFIVGSCENVLRTGKYKYDAVVVDPPRAGLKTEVIDAIVKTRPQRIVYVSCNPATLARDLKVFTESKYKVQEVQPLDMFPRTSHVETVVRIYRG